MKKLHQSEVITRNGQDVRFQPGEDECPVCGSGGGGPTVYKYAEYSIIKCDACSTMHLYPIPDDESLNLIYNTNYYKDDDEQHGYKDYRKDEKMIRKTYRRRFGFIKSNLSDECMASGVLEIGCALGFGLQEAKGFFNSTVYGADISQEAVESCRKAGFEANQCQADGTFQVGDERKYGLVYAFDVLEHLRKTEGFTTWIDSILVDDGVFALTTPNMNGFLNRILGSRTPSIKIPQHITYFTTDTLQYALKDKFKLVGSKIDCQYVSMRALLLRVRHILGLSYNSLRYIPETNIAVPNGMKIYLFKKNDGNETKDTQVG